MKIGSLQGVDAWKAGSAPPPGTYQARIDDASEGESSGGHPQFIFSWTVVGGQYDGAELTEYLVVPEQDPGHSIALSKLVALLQATEIDYSVDDFELKPEMLLGKRATIVCIGEPGFKDPTKTFTKIAGHKSPREGAESSNGHAPRLGDRDESGKPLPF